MPNLAGYAVGADGFPFSGAHAARRAGLSQSQGSDFESRGEKLAFYTLQKFYEKMAVCSGAAAEH